MKHIGFISGKTGIHLRHHGRFKEFINMALSTG